VAAPPGAAPARRWPRRLLIGLCGFVALCIVFVGSGYAYLRWRFEQLTTVSLPDLQEDEAGKPMNMLMIGTDSRANIAAEDRAKFCQRADCSDQAGPARTDTMMVLHINPKQKKAAILSIPRDLSVTIADTNRADRINTAFTTGGRERLIKTIQTGLGVQVNHYAEVDFVGFKAIVDAVGGVEIPFPSPARDLFSNLDVPQAGCIELDGTQALAYARSRHYQQLDGGRWSAEDPRADIGRIERQKVFIQRMMHKAVSQGLHNPLKLNKLIGIGIDHVTVDDQLSTKDIRKLAQRFRSLDPEKVDLLTLPTTPIGRGSSYQGEQLLQPLAQVVIDYINGVDSTAPGGALSVKPIDVRVRVLNGTGTTGLARRVSGDLRDVQFNVADIGDADNFNYTRTVIRHQPKQLAKAQLLQRALLGGAQLVSDDTLQGVDVVLVIGRDYAGLTDPVARPTTTSVGATSTVRTTTTIGKRPQPVPESQGAPIPLPDCS
jgi:LCP family protein required for cell wall assembly